MAKYTAEYQAVSKQNKISTMASTALFILELLPCLCSCSSILAYFINDIFNIPTDLSTSARVAFIVMGVNVALMILAGSLVISYMAVNALIYGNHAVSFSFLLMHCS